MPNPFQKLVRKSIRDLINLNRTTINKKAKQQPNSTELGEDKPSISKKSRYIRPSVRVSVLNRDNYKCVFCGRSAAEVELEIDHIQPHSRGGSNDISNLQTLCRECNRGKGGRNLN